MALVFPAGGGGVTRMRSAAGQLRPPSFSTFLVISLVGRTGGGGGGRGAPQVVGARRGMSSRTRRLEDRGKKGRLTTKPPEEESEGGEGAGVVGEGEAYSSSSLEGAFAGTGGGEQALSAGPLPGLPGLQPDFWEGSQWDTFGFVVQYLWAFGVLFALVACGVAVATYNEGATDFKQTPVYKESLQSRDLLEEPDSSSTDVFEANPTEEAPSLT